ncbi:hypothetical protein L873DRAFT_1799723 [Choiromyces venosus 120613-1]|uniref:RNA polymerase sigma factor 70 region 4 type 2 domain-containing protein n=1 Tax=Choiromyces venosus 120613-1 TaxID=1336337 RepID=A0A3N4K4V4_9PEZI|nr:hypothetical protein L873DRAFT_1799723 [Choiromyces venosus 120613-1]
MVQMNVNNSGEHGAWIPLDRRAAILALHWYGEKSWLEIATCLGVYPETARRLIERAKVLLPLW